jgi:hypothetical protein
MYTKFYSKKSEARISHGRPKCTWEDNIKMDFKIISYGLESIWLRIGTSGRFHKMCNISRPAEQILAYQETLCSMELINQS